MKSILVRFWFKLTVSVQCAWCRQWKRRAPLQFLYPRQISHGICRGCCPGLIPTGYEDETGFHYGTPNSPT